MSGTWPGAARRVPDETPEDYVLRVTEAMVAYAGVTTRDPFVFHARLVAGDADSIVSRFYRWRDPEVVVDFFTDELLRRRRDRYELTVRHRQLAESLGMRYALLPSPDAIPAPGGGEAFATRPRPYSARDNNPVGRWDMKGAR